MDVNTNFFNHFKDKRNTITIKSILLKKLKIISFISLLILLSFLITKHYFYILDSYYYTVEFHFNFIKNHIKDSENKIFAEYFMSLKDFHKILPFLFISYLIQTFYTLYPTPILISSTISAIGFFKGILINYLALFITGILILATSYFFLKDFSKILMKKYPLESPKKNINYLPFILINAMFSIPTISIIFPSIVSPILNINFKKIVFSLSLCLISRLFLQITYLHFI